MIDVLRLSTSFARVLHCLRGIRKGAHPAVNMLRVPDELLDRITRTLCQPQRYSIDPALASLVRVCKHTHHVALPFLYKHPHTHGRRNVRALFRTLLENGVLANMVETLFLGGRKDGPSGHDPSYAFSMLLGLVVPRLPHCAEACFEHVNLFSFLDVMGIVHNFPALRTLRVMCLDDDAFCDIHRAHVYYEDDGAAFSVGTLPFPPLQELAVQIPATLHCLYVEDMYKMSQHMQQVTRDVQSLGSPSCH